MPPLPPDPAAPEFFPWPPCLLDAQLNRYPLVRVAEALIAAEEARAATPLR
jgi:hypothetical protein